jgi:hypothetical protein
MTLSSKLSNIKLEDSSTWQDKLFLTIDIDWAHDRVLACAIDFLDRFEAHATWFVTHHTLLLQRLRENQNYELGIHPNFNWLLSGDPRNGASATEVIDRLIQIVPEARSVRSHSMTQSTGLLQAFADAGLTHDANHFIPASSGVELKPWMSWNGMIRVPYCWEDDIFCTYRERGVPEPDVTASAQRSGLRVFDFHPIHIFLNTESMKRYEQTRSVHQHPEVLFKHRYSGYGVRSRLLALMKIMTGQKVSHALSEVAE